MTEIYLIRHTQAEGNLYRMMQGHWDGMPTPLGLQQIEALARRFADVPVDAIYSSDLMRTLLTAEAVQRGRDLKIRVDPRLREIHLGPWEQRFFGELAWETPELLRLFLQDPENWVLEGAETFAQVRARAMEALREIAEKNDGKTVAVVTHGVTTRNILSAVTGMPITQVPIVNNTAVSHLLFEDGNFRADTIGDVSHLTQAELPDWKRAPEMRGEPLNFGKYGRFYGECYGDAWEIAHGSRSSCLPDLYVESALQHAARDPQAVQLILYKDDPAGLLDLDTQRGAELGVGWISFLYLLPEYRHRGIAPQLLARALKLYGDEGRRVLQLCVAEDNRDALDFYARSGFREIERKPGTDGLLLTLERPIRETRERPEVCYV